MAVHGDDETITVSSASANLFGTVFHNHQALLAQYQQQNSPANAPTAMMIDPSLQRQPVGPPQQRQPVAPPQQRQPVGPPQQPNNASNPPQTSNLAPHTIEMRSLPSPNIDAKSIDDAYVQFIFYCNPSISLSTDTAELRKGFRSMPKSEGNSFDTFKLFTLIKRLEAKELDTWSQLVVELGVEPPDPSKNQSAQKVQQFAVRMKVKGPSCVSIPFLPIFEAYSIAAKTLTSVPYKRWLHAFHIDAFFQYCLGKPTSYSTEVPPAEESVSDTIRDGVPPEEDLALRALLPEWRPKRGRRKMDGNDGEFGTPPKRGRREGSMNAEDLNTPQVAYSAQAQTSFPWGEQSVGRDNAWTTAQRAIVPKTGQVMSQQQAFVGQPNFWMESVENAPSSPYPQSAITPRHSQANYDNNDTPQSAHPLTAGGSNRPRKRHGPSVSAAWPSGGNSSSGKLPRGRPPSNRSVQDGPFSTFPANPPSASPGPRLTTTPHPDQNGLTNQSNPAPASATAATPTGRKPNKLSLQVPQHSGGPVRLATPPPKVLVNGEDGSSTRTSSYTHERRSSADFFASVDDEASTVCYESDDQDKTVDWKRRCKVLQRKLTEKEAELKAMKRRVLEAVM